MTTLADMQAGAGGLFGYVMAIEGYEYLLVDGSNESNVLADAVSTAGAGWNGTAWSQALAGLIWNPTIKRKITPWEHKFDVPSIQCTVMGQLHGDQFGIDSGKRGTGNQTELAADLDADDTTVTVVDTSSFAASGSIWVGTERIKYTGKTATTFTGCTRGYLHPFATASGTANQFGRAHKLPALDWDVAYPPKVTDQPRKWIGRHVGVWAHSIHDGVWDTLANAHPLWAGSIVDVDGSEAGSTLLALEDLSGKLRNTTLFREQYRGLVSEGLNLANNIGANIGSARARTVNTTPSTDTDTAHDLTLTTGSEANTWDIPPGRYTTDELCEQITDWLSNDSSIAGAWTVDIAATSEGRRTRITLDLTGTAYTGLTFATLVLSRRWAEFLGFTSFETESIPNGQGAKLGLPTLSGTGSAMRYSEAEPARVWIDLLDELALDGSQGTWWDNSGWLPQVWQDQVDTSQSWGILQVGQKVFALARRISDTQFEIRESDELTRQFGGSSFAKVNYRIGSESGGAIEVRQIVVMQGSFADLLNRIVYSTGAATYNHATYDEFPAHLGAGFPGSLLDADFEASLDVLSESSTSDSTMVVLAKATPLEKVIGAELLMRNAHLTWDAGYEFVTPQSRGGVAVHTLNETNKRSSMTGDPQAASSHETNEHMYAIVKIAYNKNLASGQFEDELQVVNPTSIHEHDTQRALTIEAHNSYGQYAPTGDAVKDMAADLVANVLPMWSVPILSSRRTIGPAHYEGVKLGDIATVSDDGIRNPETGVRSITGKPGLILEHVHSWGGHGKEMMGEVAIAFAALDDEPMYSPCGYVASYADPILTLETHAHTKATENADGSFFAQDDEVLIVERDPTSAAAAQSWQPSLNSVSGNDLDVGTLAGYDAAKKYMVVPALYGDAAPSQLSKAFLADDADLQIQDSRRPYVWGALYNGGSFAAGDAQDLPERHANEWFGEGWPVNPGSHDAIVRHINNALSYKMAIHVPWIFQGGPKSTPSAAKPDWVLLAIRPVGIGVGYVVAQPQRTWRVRPQMRSSSAGQAVDVRVTFCRTPPVSTSGNDVVMPVPFRQLTFTTSLAAYTILTEQSVEPVVNPETGEGWVIVEGRSANTSTLDLLGFPLFYTGPFA